MKKILVTGGSGFIGKCIAEFLQKQGYQVMGVSREKHDEYIFPVVQCDLSKPIEIDNSFDIIIHAAGEKPQREQELREYKKQDFREFKKNNIDVMSNLIDFAKKRFVKRIIYLSSIGIYGEFRDEIINEKSDVINPDTYGLTKYVAECLLRAEKSIENISLRMPGIIGPGAHGVWMTNVIDKMRNDEDVKIYSPDFQTKNFIWIEDLVRFIGELIEMEQWKYNVLVLACKKSASIREIVEKIKQCTNSKSNIIIDNNIRNAFCLDNGRAVEMGYETISPLEIVEKYIMGEKK